MVKEIEADYSQQFLLPPSLEDWVASNHPVRFLRLFVESLDLTFLGFKERESIEGRPNYSNDLLLKIWLYGYFERIYSSRQLERACKNQLPLIWLTGLKYPDHNTIWRFFRANRSCLKEVFKQSVQLAVKNEMVGFALQAVDGTKIDADVSKRQSLHKADLEKLLSSLDSSVDEILSEIDSVEKSESELPGYVLPSGLEDEQHLKSLIKTGLQELESSGTDHLSLTDRDSRMMHSQGSTRFSYNAQSVVDEKDHVIVASDVSQDASDNHHLVDMIEEAVENTESKSEETVADGGYFSGEELSRAEEGDHNVVVNKSGAVGKCNSDDKGDFSKDHFKFDKSLDEYTCPVGKRLKYERTAKRKKRRYSVRIYRCKEWRDCKFRDQCSHDKRGRSIERGPYDDVVKRQLEKHKRLEIMDLLGRRKTIVEPLFGWIKHNLGFRRWSYRGLKSVNAQWNLICTTINLKKLYKKWQGDGLNFS